MTRRGDEIDPPVFPDDEALFEHHLEMSVKEAVAHVSTVATRLVRSQEDAENLSQEVLLAVVERLRSRTGEPVIHPRRWLAGATANRCISDFRRATRKKRGGGLIELPLEEAIGKLFDPDTPEDAVLRREDEKALRSRVSRLSARQREVVELFLEGHRLIDIACMLGLPPNTVKTRIHAAIQRLRGHLGPALS